MGWAGRSTLNSKTRIGPNSGLSSSAPLAHFSEASVIPGSEKQQREAQPSRSKPHLLATSAQSRKKLGQKIQTLREQFALTQEQLSKECGMTVTKLKMIEAGQADPRLFTVISLAEKLKTTTEDLLKEIE